MKFLSWIENRRAAMVPLQVGEHLEVDQEVWDRGRDDERDTDERRVQNESVFLLDIFLSTYTRNIFPKIRICFQKFQSS